MGVSFGYKSLCFDISCGRVKKLMHVPSTQGQAPFHRGFHGPFCPPNSRDWGCSPNQSLASDPRPLASEGSLSLCFCLTLRCHAHRQPLSLFVFGKLTHPSGIVVTFLKSLLVLPVRKIPSPLGPCSQTFEALHLGAWVLLLLATHPTSHHVICLPWTCRIPLLRSSVSLAPREGY